MTMLRTDIERALDEFASQEEGMRFQGLAVVLGKKRWPELIACERKNDLGLDAYAPSSLTPEKIGKGLSASITPTLGKISGDAKTAKENFSDLKTLLFVTSGKVGNPKQKQWKKAIQEDHGLELHIIGREDIIIAMMMPENASLCARFLHLDIAAEPQVAELIDRTRRAADAVTRTWAVKTKGHPLIDLTAVRLDPNGAESADVLSLEQIDQALSQSWRIVLEGSAGRGKTTTLIQIAQRARTAGTPFIVELPAWTSSRRGILEYIAGMPAFQAEGLTPADLARVQQTEPFLFLLNGWNEIAESNSPQSNDALRDLERDFPSAGIIVATRTHHLTPPLPGAMRLRLLRLRRVQRVAYLAARLGAKGAELRARIDADPSLDELTRTPFVLSEVASLFEASAEIPSTKIGILAQVLRLQEQRDEHRNALQTAPIFGEQTEYLKALAAEMTRRGAVALPDADARSVVAAVARELAHRGQIEIVGAPAVLATLTAHHVFERVDYPQTAFQFEHQQLQEYYAALDVRTQLLDLRGDDHDATGRFTADYVNDPAWAEPLRMIAETFAEQTGNGEIDRANTRAGGKLVEMALAVDLVFAAELAQLCGATVWNEVRAAVGERLRALYAIRDGRFRQYAVAAMLATGADDFSDIIAPLLSGQDQQTRLRTYRLWPDIQVSSLGVNWREQVRGWSEEARTDFVCELLHHRVDGEIAAFAAEDDSVAVKKAAVSGLMWTGSDDALTPVLDSMDAQTFEEVARQNADHMPAALRPKTIAAMRKFIESTTDHPARLRTALDLIELGELGLDGVIKGSMAALSGGEMRNLSSHYVQPALEYLRRIDPAWVSEWVATQIAEGILYEHEYWLPFATTISDGLVEKYLQRLESEDLKNVRFGGMISIIAARADANLAARVFVKLRELRRGVDAEPGVRHELEWQIVRQLEAVFRDFPDDIAAAGILSSVTTGDPLDIKVVAGLLCRVARSDVEPLRIADDDLKARLRTCLKSSVDIILRQDDFNGEEKANLASSIAQVGEPEDMADLVRLVRADIERVRRGRAARAAGDHGPLGNGGSMSYAGWHIAAVMHLDPVGAEQVLIDLLPEPEYLSEAAAAMARDFVPKREPFDRTFRYNLIWSVREGRVSSLGDGQRRPRFAAVLNAEIKRLREQNQDGKPPAGLKVLARALAAIDGRGSAAAVLDVIAMPGQWDEYVRLDAAELLLMAGVVLPAATAFALVDAVLERTEKWMQDSDRYLLRRILALCPFVDTPAAGIAKMRDVLGKRRLWAYELRELVTALGESRSDAAIDLLYELASDAQTFGQCEDNFINAFAAFDTPRANELLLGFVDPDIRGIALTRRPDREDVLVARLTELVRHRPEAAARLRELCERDLPEPNRHILSKVMASLGTPEALVANLNLIDDTKRSPVPQGIWDQLESALVERRPYGQNPNVFTQHARASNEVRVRLFRMVIEDEKRRKSAFMLLGQIEEWRLEHGRPTDEPRHPDLGSGQPWPPEKFFS
ncbi:MAG: hypothetical protein OHM77_07290 [Candidatus Nitricoxidivorans perseverans]|uniref:NACHT C-terminal Alpha/Beta 2 domain-containing protein n=1 Tax=Candidatus Nitricoxidivorans perseverans TaxID=2975601 RepID=A0AA49ITM9_9PROT|nr:MAG: hypothetical protein OHM77_07290 [Candidatus Nitricoxidivorans perseverans]